MKSLRSASLIAAVAVASVALAGKVDVPEFAAGQALDADHGLVVLRLDWARETKGGAAKTTTRDDQQVYIVLKEATGKTKDRYIVASPDTTKAFILPAGRWYLAELFTPGNRGLPQITRSAQATLQSFQVMGDTINFAGWWTLRLARDTGGEESFSVNIDYGPDAVREATETFPDIFTQKPLMYCAIGRACKALADFKR